VSVPEIGTVKAKTTPYVVVTSNNIRDLSDALKRRCLHLFIGYPDEQRELEIIRLKVPAVGETLAAQVVDVIRRMRSLDLRKAPSISETLDWVQALVLLNAELLNRELIEETLQLLVKYDCDAQQVREHVTWLLEGGHDHHHHDHHGHGHHHHHHGPDHPLRPPRRPAEPDQQNMEERKLEHTARYFTTYRGRVDGKTGGV
jgi:MoxR-like ATPase